MNTGEIVSSVISSVAVVMLAGITRALSGARADLRRFMLEHTWLLATTVWSRDMVVQIMRSMELEPPSPPPADLPARYDRKT